jgi:hypothetical protein
MYFASHLATCLIFAARFGIAARLGFASRLGFATRLGFTTVLFFFFTGGGGWAEFSFRASLEVGCRADPQGRRTAWAGHFRNPGRNTFYVKPFFDNKLEPLEDFRKIRLAKVGNTAVSSGNKKPPF